MTDLQTTWDAARKGLAWVDYKALLDGGVSKRDLATMMAAKAPGADDIAIVGKRWQRRFMGERAIVLPVTTPAGGLADLVAFRLGTPRSFWLLDGCGTMLGYEALRRAEFMDEPLFVHETPFEWLCGGCEGIVILDWSHYWPSYFFGIPILRTASAAFGRRLRDNLQHPLQIPEIQVAT